MIQLTPTTTRTNKKDVEVDATIYLERLDSNNLVLKEGENILGYFGDARVALTRSLNYALKSSAVHLSLENILEIVKSMDATIKTLKSDSIEKDA